MVERSDYYVRYARWAYEWIYIRQYEENVYFGIRGRVGAGPASAERGGFLATKSCSERTCTVECTQIVKDNVCTFNNGSPGQVEKEMANICDTYLAQVKKQLTTFWQDQVLDVVKIWEKYGQQAQDKLDSTTCD